LATFPLVAGLPQADLIFHLVFFIVLTSVLLQGTSIPLVARWLGVDDEGGWRIKAEALSEDERVAL
jgi:cell volume regulation protein A